MEDTDNHFFQDFQVFLRTQSFSEHISFERYKFTIGFMILNSKRQSGVIVLRIVIALNNFTLVCNVISVLVEVVNFVIVKVDNFCKYRIDYCVFQTCYRRKSCNKTQDLLF